MSRIEDLLKKWKSGKLFAFMTRYKVLQLLIPAAIIASIYWQGRQEFRRIDWGATLHFIRRIPPVTFLYLIVFSLAAVAMISGYDFIIRRHFRLPIGRWAMFRYAWIANTTNSVIGFAGIAGAGLRTYLLRKRGIPISTIAAAIAFISTFTITGLSLLAWAGILGILPIKPILNAHPVIRYVVWADALFLPLFVWMQRSRLFAKWFNPNKRLTDWGTIAASVGVSLVEWVFAGLTFWLIGSHVLAGLSVTHALAIFSVAAVTGLVSMAPGGIGGFDLTALLGLGLLGYDPGKSAAVLVLFRLLYYIVPWLIGLVMAAFEFTIDRKKNEQPDSDNVENVLNRWQKIWLWPGQLGKTGEIGAWALGKLVFACGFVLLLSAATPRLLERLRFADELLSVPLMRLSHQLSVVIGFMLIVLSWGISHRVRNAYWCTLFLLSAGAIFTFAKAFDFEEAIFLLIVAILLWISRDEFDQAAVPITRKDAAIWGIVTLAVSLLDGGIGTGTRPGFLKYLPPNVNMTWLFNSTEQTVTAIVALAITWLIISLLLILRKR